MRILVTDAEQRSSLAVVRSLGRAGHEVHVCSSQVRPLSGASRWAHRVHFVPDPVQSPEMFQNAVAAMIRRLSVEMLIPITDTSLTALSGILDLCPHLILPFSDWEAYECLSDKGRLADIAPTIGIAVPDQVVIERPEDFDPEALERLGYPLVLKPSRSVVNTEQGLTKHAVRIVASREALGDELRAIPPPGFPVLAQERIRGVGKGVFILVWDGQVYAVFGHRRIREKPPTGGVSVYRESVAVSPDLIRRSASLLKSFGWNGVAMIEFKEDADSGTHYLMEVNARFWGSLQLAVDAGVDFPKLLVDIATGLEVDPVKDYRLGVRSRWLWGEIDHFLACLRAPRIVRRELPNVPSPLGALVSVIAPWKRSTRYEVLQPSDPLPFLRESVNWFKALCR